MSLQYPNPSTRNLNSTNAINKVLANLDDLKPVIDEINLQGTIAYIERVNMKDIATNSLTWKEGCSASNTVSESVIVKVLSGIYQTKSIPGIPASTIIVFDPTKFPDINGNSPDNTPFLIRIALGDVDLYNEGNAGFASNVLWMDFVKTIYEGNSFTVSINGLNMTISGGDGSLNGTINTIETRGADAGGFTNSLSSSPAFSGGIDPLSTDFGLKMNGVTILDASGSTVSSSIIGLDITKIFSSIIRPFILDRSGDWTFPITTGTEEDFILSIYIKGKSI